MRPQKYRRLSFALWRTSNLPQLIKDSQAAVYDEEYHDQQWTHLYDESVMNQPTTGAVPH